MLHTPHPDLNHLTNYRNQLALLANQLAARCKKLTLSISRRNDGTFFTVIENGQKKYLSKKDISTLKDIFQNDYEYKLYQAVSKELKILDSFLKKTNLQLPEEIYKNMANETKPFIKPLLVSNEDFAKAWQAKKYTTHPDQPNTSFITFRQEHVRSKSEVIIADTLNEMGIPYRYEQELKLKDGNVLYPDFTLLNVSTREEIIYEHFGKMDDEPYLHRTFEKLDIYARNGFTLGKNLIATFESLDHSINRTTLIKTLEKCAK